MLRQLFCLLLLMPVLACAQSKYLATPEDVRKSAEGIIASVAAGNPSAAWKELKPLSVVPPAEFEVFEAQFGSQSGTLFQRFGSATGYELIREEPLGTSLIRYTFLVRHEKAPMRWLLLFYRAEKGWVVTDFKFDGNTTALFAAGS
jgi:hypothetical protein